MRAHLAESPDNVGEGKYSHYSDEGLAKKLVITPEGEVWEGVAGRVPWLDTETLCFDSYADAAELGAYQDEFFTAEKLVSDVPGELKWDTPVHVLVNKGRDTPGTIGKWRRLSGDTMLQAYAAKCKSWLLMPKKGPSAATREKVLKNLAALGNHIPLVIQCVSDVDNTSLFLLSWKIIEDFRKKEERNAPSGWFVIELLDKARRHGLDSPAQATGSPNPKIKKGCCGSQPAVKDVLAEKVQFASSSDYKDGKIRGDLLRVFDRFKSAGLDKMMKGAKAVFGAKTYFDSCSKLVKISQTVYSIEAGIAEAARPGALKYVVELHYVRMLTGSCDMNCPAKDVAGIVTRDLAHLKFVQEVASIFVFQKDTPESRITSIFAEPLQLFPHLANAAWCQGNDQVARALVVSDEATIHRAREEVFNMQNSAKKLVNLVPFKQTTETYGA